jgi:hypothetical protein
MESGSKMPVIGFLHCALLDRHEDVSRGADDDASFDSQEEGPGDQDGAASRTSHVVVYKISTVMAPWCTKPSVHASPTWSFGIMCTSQVRCT